MSVLVTMDQLREARERRGGAPQARRPPPLDTARLRRRLHQTTSLGEVATALFMAYEGEGEQSRETLERFCLLVFECDLEDLLRGVGVLKEEIIRRMREQGESTE